MRRIMNIFALTPALALASCTAVSQEPTSLAADVAAKAQQVADEIGGDTGFGGTWMNGYGNHMADHMGFHGMAYLADEDGELDVELINDSAWPCTFHLAYIRSADGLDEQYEDVTVPPDDAITVHMPCAEIIGVGSVEAVGVPAANLQNGLQYGNQMCVPGFLNSDYVCGGTYSCTLSPDEDDLDGDGDTQELIVVTEGMWSHMGSGGMGRHMSSDGGWFGGMMGGSMMGGRP